MTDQKAVKAEPGNTKTGSSEHKNWFFTYNNWEKAKKAELISWFNSLDSKYVVQEETGNEGTPHLQGVVSFKSSKKFSQMKKHNDKIHWEKCKNIKAAVDYCSKIDTRSGECIAKGFAITPQLDLPFSNYEMKQWQKDICNLIETKPDNRTINWYYDLKGNIGKTELAKHICLNYNALYVQGKASDVKFGVTNWIKEKKSIDVIIYGIPRSYENFVSYDVLESIKDGIFFSTKYESEMIIFNSPHIIVLCNFMPDESKLSSDRWKITNLGSDKDDEIMYDDIV